MGWHRTTDQEPGFPVQEAWRTDDWEPDPLVLDDQAIVLNVRDRALVIFTGCGHAGIVNIARYACVQILARCTRPSWYRPTAPVGGHTTPSLELFGAAYVADCVGTRFDL